MPINDDFAPVIPPGGGGGAPLGPGAMVANTLQQILAQRRAEAHSDLIEKLTQENTNRRLNIEQQQANTQDGYRKGLEADRAALTQGRLADQARTAKQAQDWNNLKTQLAPGNPLYDNLPTDQQRGLGILKNFEYDHPLVQDFMKRVITPESPKNDMVPQFRFNNVTGQREQIMDDATPPLVGKVPHLVPRGQEDIKWGVAPPAPREGPDLGIKNTKTGEVSVYRAPVGVSGRVQLPAKDVAEGWVPTGLRIGASRPNLTPTGDLYDPKAADALVKTLANKKNDKKAQMVEIRNFINQGIKDKVLRGDVEHYYMNQDQASAQGLIPPSMQEYVSNMQPYEGTLDPSWATTHPQELQGYQDNLRRILSMIEEGRKGTTK